MEKPWNFTTFASREGFRTSESAGRGRGHTLGSPRADGNPKVLDDLSNIFLKKELI
jgi:hypothetical protein